MFYFYKDIDECQTPESHNCDVNALCTNIEGSYVCRCKKGYEGDGSQCIGKFFYNKNYIVRLMMFFNRVNLALDIDECSVGSVNCGPGGECINSNGSFTCQCQEGYQKSGNNCIGKACFTFMFCVSNLNTCHYKTGQWPILLQGSGRHRLQYAAQRN